MKKGSLVFIIFLSIILLGIYFLRDKETKYENIRIISDNPSAGIPSKII